MEERSYLVWLALLFGLAAAFVARKILRYKRIQRNTEAVNKALYDEN